MSTHTHALSQLGSCDAVWLLITPPLFSLPYIHTHRHGINMVSKARDLTPHPPKRYLCH